MTRIHFSTTNQRKITEARAACDLFGIEVIPIKLEFDEIQSYDPINISLKKAHDAFALAGKSAIVVADTSWSIPSLDGFPGGYMKDVAEWFDPSDFINLLSSKEDRTVIFRESITYEDANEVKVFSKEYRGTIAHHPRGAKGNSIEQVAEFNGLTLAESQEKGQTSHNPEEYIWYEFADWFSKKSNESALK